MSTIYSPPGPAPATYRHWVQWVGCDGQYGEGSAATTWRDAPAGHYSIAPLPDGVWVRVAGFDAVTGTHAPGISEWQEYPAGTALPCPEPGSIGLLACLLLLVVLRSWRAER